MKKSLHLASDCASISFAHKNKVIVVSGFLKGLNPAVEIVKLIFIIIQLIICLALIAIIILQTGKNSGLSAFSGQNETYLSKNKAKSRDARLALATKWFAGTFVVLTLVLNLM